MRHTGVRHLGVTLQRHLPVLATWNCSLIDAKVMVQGKSATLSAVRPLGPPKQCGFDWEPVSTLVNNVMTSWGEQNVALKHQCSIEAKEEFNDIYKWRSAGFKDELAVLHH